MNKTILIFLTVASSVGFYSCSTSDPNSPGFEYMPDMYRGPAYEAYSESPFSKEGSSLKPVVGSIPRNPVGYGDDQIVFSPYPFANNPEGYEAAAALTSPLQLNLKTIEQGKHLYGNNCQHCHGEKGDGNGVLVQDEKINGVPSYFSDALKELPIGKMYHVITYGKNTMGSHASQLNPKERWQVIQYVQKLRADGLGVKLNVDSLATSMHESTAQVSTLKDTTMTSKK